MKNQLQCLAIAILCCIVGFTQNLYASGASPRAQQLSTTNQYGIPADIQSGNILHCFDWTATQIIDELPSIAEAGFGAVQISPVQGNAKAGAEWYYAYLPYDFAVKGNVATKAQLTQLCAEADKYGIKIVVDVVANHVNQASGYHDSWWDSNGRVRWNGGINYGDRYSITHGQLGDYGDVNSEDSQVQARAKAFVEELKSCGVDGIRWDAAKHIGLPSEGCNFWSTVASVAGMWHYGEILDGPGGDKYGLLKEYTNYIGVTDSEYSTWVRNEVNKGSVPSGNGSWGANGVPTSKMVLWGESHDTYSNDGGESKGVSQDKIDRAWAIGACRAAETSLYFSRPAATDKNAIKIGQKGSTRFKNKEIAAINHLRNAAVGTRDYYNGSNGIATITREGVGAAIIIGAGGSRQVSVTNGGGYCPEGTYVDEVSGNTFTVTATTISGQVGNTGIAVIYNSNQPKTPAVTLNPNGGAFTSATIDVTATLVNATSGWYKIGNGAQTSFTGSTTFTVGEGLAAGESVTVSWSATGEGGTKTGSAKFSKVDPSAKVYVYYNNPNGWESVNCYIYTPNTTPIAKNAEWPGCAMTKDASTGLWSYEVPDEFVKGTKVIFNGTGGQYPQDTPGQACGLDLDGVSMICKDNSSWTIYTGGNGGDIDDPDVAPAVQYILGNLAKGSWKTNVGVEMTKDGNIFTATNVELVAIAGETNAFFTFVSVLGTTGASSEWDDVINGADRYGAVAKDAPITVGSTVKMQKFTAGVDASKAYSWAVAPGKYDIQADYKNMTVKVVKAGTLGVDDIEVEEDADVAPVYYNLQGLKVDNPQSGALYIVVRGSKVSKQIFRD